MQHISKNSIDCSFNDWVKIKTIIPNNSILGPLLFDIFFIDILLFITKCNLRNYADGTCLYGIEKRLNAIKTSLESDFAMYTFFL